MQETIQLVATFDELVKSGNRAVLATVIDVQGSTYRLPGARMLICEDGSMTGLVSGGCLEADLFERAKPVYQDGKSTCVRYDHSAEEDIVWGLGLGCAGVVHILLEPVDRQRTGPIELLRACLQARKPGYLATSISADGQIAGRWLMFPDGTTSPDQWHDAPPDFSTLTQQRTRYTLDRGHGVALERLDPRIRLVLFGAGHDVLPLAQLADSLGWVVEVYDHRPAYIRPDRFPATVVPQLYRPEQASSTVTIDDWTAILLMTHHYPSDTKLLQAFANSDARYIGALGPKRRTETMLNEIRGREKLAADKLYAPAGLDIGGEAPELVALAIIAEIQAVFNRREGGLLRNRREPIHERRR